MLDVSRTIEKTQAVEYLPSLCDMAPDLDDRSGIAGGEPACDLVLVERRWDHRERVISREQRNFRGGGAGSHGRDTRNDLDPVPAHQAGEYIDEAPIEQRV